MLRSSQAIALAIPGFFALIGVEWVASRIRRRDIGRFNDGMTALGCGVAQQTLQVFTTAIVAWLYVSLYEHFALTRLDPARWTTWVIGIVGVDFFYYWWHRTSHRSNAFWAIHVVHHQSQEYNLAVALRQSMFSNFSGILFDLPLAIVGVPPQVFLISAALNTLYQFWIHTRLLGRLGPIEWILNCPSHHRVHHAVNPKYIDKNYAGIFIIWDRMFGTFIDEQEEPQYGTVRAYGSWNPIWANFEPWVHLWNEARAARTWGDALKIWFAPPEWRGTGLKPHHIPEPDPRARKWDIPYPKTLNGYVAFQFAIVATLLTALLWDPEVVDTPLRAILCLCIGVSIVSWGGLFEGKTWAR
ncbi:MAG TPA: sterol desaturase family protein, partial [Bdellovibrionota bacterium]|nr:sterol desaturase family protein [Bdellovibrionota bacterium]